MALVVAGRLGVNNVSHGAKDTSSRPGALGGFIGIQEGGHMPPVPRKEAAVEALWTLKEAEVQKHGPLGKQAEAHPPMPK